MRVTFAMTFHRRTYRVETLVLTALLQGTGTMSHLASCFRSGDR